MLCPTQISRAVVVIGVVSAAFFIDMAFGAGVWYVDFDVAQGGDGTEINPFPGLRDALAVAADGDTVRFFGDSTITYSFENPRITTALRMEALYGPVRIGGPSVGDTQTIMLPGDVALEMTWIPFGAFAMGRYPGEQDSYSDEDPQHTVTISGFWMAKYELTKRQWQALMGTTPWASKSYVLADLDSPAVYVSWDDAQSFIVALNSYTGLEFRLPSEAEWEYAYRGGTTTRFYWGDDSGYTEGDDYAWWTYNTIDATEYYAHLVGQKLPNPFFLYDMSGNVWEWCQDVWHTDYVGAPTDGSAWELPTSENRVGRGGGWNYVGSACRAATRSYGKQAGSNHNVGFRLAR